MSHEQSPPPPSGARQRVGGDDEDDFPPPPEGCLTGSTLHAVRGLIWLFWLGGSIWLFTKTGWYALSVSFVGLMIILYIRVKSKDSPEPPPGGVKTDRNDLKLISSAVTFLLFGALLATCCGGYQWVRSVIDSFLNICTVR